MPKKSLSHQDSQLPKKEPRSIYQNNNNLFRNSTQQVNLASPKPTPASYTDHTMQPSQ